MPEINLLGLTPNIPRANLEDYVITLYGRPKVGKTTFFYLLMKEVYKDAKAGLIVAFEEGYKALNGAMVQPVDSWQEYVSLVDQLVDNKDQLPFKVIAHDTIDRLYTMAVAFVLRRESRKDSKQYKAVQDIPYGKGHELIIGEIDAQLMRIQKAGLGLFFITHDKDKKFESRDGVSYDQTTVSLAARIGDLVLNMSDFIVFIDNAKEKVKDKVIDKRWIYLRADGSDMIAGSRFKNIRPRVEYDPAEFFEAFREAVESELENTTLKIDELSKTQADERKEESKSFIQEDKSERNAENTLESVMEQLDTLIKSQPTKVKTEISATIKGILGIANYKKVDDLEKLLEVKKAVEELLDN